MPSLDTHRTTWVPQDKCSDNGTDCWGHRRRSHDPGCVFCRPHDWPGSRAYCGQRLSGDAGLGLQRQRAGTRHSRSVQGERLEINVTNELAEPTTVHWHGLRVPVGMDGIPYLSQPPIEPGETFTYEFDLAGCGDLLVSPAHQQQRASRTRPLWRLDRRRGGAAGGRPQAALGAG